MMLISYFWGQKVYRIPYATKKLIAYFVIVLAIYFIHKTAIYFYEPQWFSLLLATILFLIFTWFISLVEKKELQKLPVIGKFIR